MPPVRCASALRARALRADRPDLVALALRELEIALEERAAEPEDGFGASDPTRRKLPVLRSVHSVVAEAMRHRVQAPKAKAPEVTRRAFMPRFARLPSRIRVLLILSTFLLAASIAAASHLFHQRAMEMKRTVFIAAEGRGDDSQILLLSLPKPEPSPSRR